MPSCSLSPFSTVSHLFQNDAEWAEHPFLSSLSVTTERGSSITVPFQQPLAANSSLPHSCFFRPKILLRNHSSDVGPLTPCSVTHSFQKLGMIKLPASKQCSGKRPCPMLLARKTQVIYCFLFLVDRVSSFSSCSSKTKPDHVGLT